MESDNGKVVGADKGLPEKKLTKELRSSIQLCEEWEISNVDVQYTEADFANLSSYKLFNQHVRPVIAAQHLKLSKSRVMTLIASKWREFCDLKDKAHVDYTSETADSTEGQAPPEVERAESQPKDGIKYDDASYDSREEVHNRKPSDSEQESNNDPELSIVDDSVDEEYDVRPAKKPSKSRRVAPRRKPVRQKQPVRRQTRPSRRTTTLPDSDEEFEAMLRIEEQGNSSDTTNLTSQGYECGQGNKRKLKKIPPPPSEVDGLGPGKSGPPMKRLNKPKSVLLAGEDENDTDHQDYCDVCRQGGEILLCDACPRAFHLICVDPEAESTPEGDWYCPICVRDGVDKEVLNKPKHEPIQTDQPLDNHMEFCRVCRDGGELLCCERCPSSYHMHCIIPAVTDIPEEEWICPRCAVERPKVQVKRIMTWRWYYPLDEKVYPQHVEAFSTASRPPYITSTSSGGNVIYRDRVREVYVKYDGLSYWHCEWLPELAVEVHQTSLWRNFWKRNPDPDIPPHEYSSSSQPGDNDPVQTPPAQDLPNRASSVENDLDERYIKFGIRIEWLTAQRIINHRKDKSGQPFFLVKWRDLPYDQATYEPEIGDFSDEIKNWQKHIDYYWKIRNRNRTTSVRSRKESDITKDESSIDPKKKYDRQPDFINAVGGTLHEYQLEGLNWLRFSWSRNTHVILADEMGLGKTVQTISFLYSLYKENLCSGPFLISAPLSTIINWEREFEFWAPDMYVVTYTGDRDCRSVIRKHEFCMDDDAFRTLNRACRLRSGSRIKFHVLLTSYELVSVDSACLSSVDWEVLVVDEAHRLKNNQSRFFKTLTDFSIKWKLLLTGTPLQNNLEELYHLLNFLSSDKFNDMTGFLSEFSDISKDNQVKKLHDMLGPHLLRRLKADVLSNMPSKSEFIVRVEPSQMQKKYYQYIIHRNYEILTMKAGGAQPSLLNVVMELKKCCNHPYLLTSAAVEAPLTKNGQYEGASLVKACGKLELLAKMLPKLYSEHHRVLIFSQMTRMMDILEDFLDFMGYKYERIDGKITGQERQDAIDRFNAPGAEQFAFLLSTRSGGLGINLATADTVVIYDSDWNPHNDIQAFSRAHRIGQQNKVMIYRFVTRDTVEERICQVAKRKMMLTHLIVRPGVGRGGQNMSKKELEDILRFGTENLFKPNEKGDVEEDDKCLIHYDDQAIERLLDRSQQGIEEKECSLNEYLSSFKVANYLVRDEVEEEIIERDEEYDNAYWEKLVGTQHAQYVEEESSNWGKGKRSRRQVNYAVPTNEENWNDQASDANSEQSKLSLNEDEDDSIDFDDKTADKRKKAACIKEKPLPPLIAQCNGGFEVIGFNARQRKAFLNAIMRFGMPPEDMQNSQWLVRDLRQKSNRELRAYTTLFMRHLCEQSVNPDFFGDGIPREGFQRQHILSRIGILSLIRKKVNEYESVNSMWSLPEMQSQELTVLSNVAKTAKVESSEVDCPDLETSKQEGSMDLDHKDVTSLEEIREAGDLTRLDVIFNIADAGFTELHNQWTGEDRDIANSQNPAKMERESWNRSHDYWLLVGIVTHGHSRWQDIQADNRFALINEPFKQNSDKGNYLEIKNKFLARRYKLLEQALVVEEQLRRARFLLEEEKLSTKRDLSRNLLNRYTELETVAECHRPLVTETVLSGPDAKLSGLIIQKVMCQLDELLIEMKNEINKLPSAISKTSTSSQRLFMSEQHILACMVTQLSTLHNDDKQATRELNPSLDPNICLENPDSIDKPLLATNLNPYYTYPVDVGRFSFPTTQYLPTLSERLDLNPGKFTNDKRNTSSHRRDEDVVIID